MPKIEKSLTPCKISIKLVVDATIRCISAIMSSRFKVYGKFSNNFQKSANLKDGFNPLVNRKISITNIKGRKAKIK